LVLLIFLLIVFLFVASLSLVFGIAYMPNTFSFLPAEYSLFINRTLINTTLPRNKQQVLIGLSEKISKIRTFNHKLFIEAKSDQNLIHLHY